MEKKKKKFSLYKVFNPDGKGLELPKDYYKGPDNLAKCFKIFKNNLSNIIGLNFLIIFGNFPLLFGIWGLTGNASLSTTAAASPLFAPLYGAMKINNSPVTSALFGIHGAQTVKYTPTTWTYVFLALSLLVLLTYGIVNTGVTYVLRSMVRNQPISLWSDFWGAIKRNLKQSLIMGALDAFIIGLLIYDIFFFALNASALMYVNMLILALYIIMRFYLYIMLITFDLSIWKLFKNALIFTLINFKRNIAAFFGILFAAALTWVIFVFFVPGGVALALAFLFSTCMFFGTYAAYPKIKEIMIDPQLQGQEE